MLIAVHAPHGPRHELGTPKEGVNQRNPKVWADVVDYALAVPKHLGLGNKKSRGSSLHGRDACPHLHF